MPKAENGNTPKGTSSKSSNRIVAPPSLEPYQFHGLDLSWREGDKNAKGGCPFCGAGDRRFQILISTGKCRCFVCGEGNEKGGMNAISFLQRFWGHCKDKTRSLSELSEHRKVSEETLAAWGVVRSTLLSDFLVPGFNMDGKICQLYKYKTRTKEGRKPKLYPTPGVGGHAIFGMNLWESGKEFVMICEGPWDGMKLWEVMGQCFLDDEAEELAPTDTPNKSLLVNTNVLAVPGANGFKEEWVHLLRNKTVNICFDNDHPRHADGRDGKSAGYEGVKRIAGMLSKVTSKINFLSWGTDEGYNESLKDGLDLRDVFTVKELTLI